jgi:hypothetical protein
MAGGGSRPLDRSAATASASICCCQAA